MPSDGPGEMTFGPFTLDRLRRRLSRAGVPIPVGGRALDVLAVLVAVGRETVSSDALLDRVWPGLTVEVNNLQVQISNLRKALGDGWIVNLPGHGYRFPEQEYFADGVVEDIITALSRIRWLFVIARNSSFAYKGTSPDIRQVGRELGVRYILEAASGRSDSASAWLHN
jgi:DNA-binding winged helix-turn-helix (wHTH) protein